MNLSFPALIKAVLLGGFYFFCSSLKSQCVYTDSYSSSAGWTMNGVSYSIGPSTFSFSATQGNAYNYATYTLPCTLPDDAWTGDIDFIYTGRGTGGTGHTLLSATAGTLNSWNIGSSYAASNEDAIELYIVSPYGGAQNTDSLFGRSKDGTIWNAASIGVPLSMNTSYYLRLQRISPVQGKISVFTDPARTVHAAGSPQFFSVTCAVTGLNTVEHGCIPQGWWTRNLTGTIDNLNIHDDPPTAGNLVVSGNILICAGGTINFTASGGTSYNWSGPNGFTSSLQNPSISNATGSDAGTYSVTATGVGFCGGPVSATVTVSVGQNGSSSNVTAAICQGQTYLLPDGTSTSSAGIFTDTISSFTGCDSIITTTVTVNSSPLVTAGILTNDTIALGESITLFATGASIYLWNNGSSDSVLTVTPNSIGNVSYCVTGTTNANCSDSVCVTIYVEKIDCGDLFVPNAFSPNGDHVNDELCIYGTKCIKTIRLQIYDRWGEKVFESSDPAFCWDGTFKGKALNSAVFAYSLVAALNTGDTMSLKGTISLVK